MSEATGRRRDYWIHESIPWLLTVLAVGTAMVLSELPIFKRISFAISDTIAQSLGGKRAEAVQLVRLRNRLTKTELQSVIFRAIPELLSRYNAAAVGVDIDFSEGGYSDLARNFSQWSSNNPGSAQKVVWAVGWENADDSDQRITLSSTESGTPCEECDSEKCEMRFTPLPVFDGPDNPINYGLGVAFPDLDAVNRMSLRFVCHSKTVERLETFHFKLVKIYCASHPDLATCGGDLSKQSRSTMYAWYDSPPIDLCGLVSCKAADAAADPALYRDIAGKVVVLYSDVPSDDVHHTIANQQKGAAIIASLIENELAFGIDKRWPVIFAERTIEVILTLCLFALFHWRRTTTWAIIPATLIFVVYLLLVTRLARWVPDFRNYVLAIILCFWIETILKLAWNNWSKGHPPTPLSGEIPGIG